MNIERLRAYCLEKKEVIEDDPFGPEVLAFKVAGKLFALVALDEVPKRINLKCDPERAIDLRERHESVLPGYHMSKKHWNTVVLDGAVPDSLIIEWVDHSYDLVVGGLRKVDRERIRNG